MMDGFSFICSILKFCNKFDEFYMYSFFNFIIIFSIILNLNIYPQSGLYMPKEINSAYQNNTRSFTGKPGAKYWQNFARYDINASIEPETKELQGSLKLFYENNSPDTLRRIVFKLYQNMHKKGAARNITLSEAAITDGMEITKLLINKTEYSLNPSDKMTTIQGTNLIVNLKSPMPPKTVLESEVEWNFVIPPGENLRMGVIDSATFFVAYWYPRIAVYDDINGWDMHSYNGEHEYYFDYSDYNVNITMPYGYVVWGTGMPKNLNDILSSEIFNKYVKASAADSVINVITASDLKKKNIFKVKKDSYTWNYNVENIPDFAFGSSAHYVWQMTSVKMNGRKVIVQTAFNPAAESFKEIISFAKGAVEQFPQGPQSYPYPYPQLTIFHGESGMEFPMIVNQEAFPNRMLDVYVTIHEATHMFFPFHTAMSETRYAWFDEGMAYFLPQRIQLSFDPSDHRARAAKGYANYAGRETDLPLMTPSFFIREPDLSMLNYYKPAVAFDILMNMIGEELFRKCMHEFITLWNGKHPTPYDFFFTFNRITGIDLNWFWKKWFFEKGYPDIAIKDVITKDGKVRILIERLGNYPIPVELTFTNAEGKTGKISRTASIWKDQASEVWIDVDIPNVPVKVEAGADWIPDSNLKNNIWMK
jgi:hypothetical protein